MGNIIKDSVSPSHPSGAKSSPPITGLLDVANGKGTRPPLPPAPPRKRETPESTFRSVSTKA
jgi:hypothetical protein